MKKLLFNLIVKTSLPVMLLAAAFTQSKAQGDADPAISLVMTTAVVPLGAVDTLIVRLDNIGQTTDIVANSLEATVSLGGNGEIVGILPGISDTNWTQFSLSAGTGNTIKLRNTNGGLAVFDFQYVYLLVKATVALPIFQTITGHIQYFNGNNPLLGGLQNVTQGNTETVNDNNTTSLTVVPRLTDPDFNVTYVNKTVTGNVSTNDDLTVDAIYSTPVAVSGHTNPSGSVPVMNADGTYSFVTSVPGSYQFSVPVCYQSVCTSEYLEITVLNDTAGVHNPPVANIDITSTLQNTPVTVPVLGNDRPGTPGYMLPPGNVAVIGTPTAGGTATVNPDGTITFTPPTGFTGVDTIRYQVCDNGSPSLCDTSYVIVEVIPTGGANTTTASDDYATTPMYQPVSGNVLTNDRDAEGNTQMVVAQNITIQNIGTFVLNTNGTYIFTPDSGFVGPVDFPYAVYDNGTPVAGDTATLHVLVPAIVSPLPVRLSSFTANAVPGQCAAQLQWTTGEEKNFDHFTVQYSTDGGSFQSAGNVKSNGNTMGSTYNYTMEQPAGRMYYRLQMTDKDGTTGYSNTLSVWTKCNAGAAATWSVYPNPSETGRMQYLQYTSTGNSDQALKVVASDLMGRRIWTADLKAVPGKNVYSIPSGNWPRGTYLIRLYDQQGGAVDVVQKITLH